MNGMLKSAGDPSIYRELHRMEGILARAHVNWQEHQLKSRDTSAQKEPQPDDEQKKTMVTTRRTAKSHKMGLDHCQ